MVPSLFLCFIISIGCIPLGLSSFYPILLPIAIFYNSLILMLVMLDFILTPHPTLISTERLCDSKLSLGANNLIKLRICNQSSFHLKTWLKDEPPPQFETKDRVKSFVLPPKSQIETAYIVIPKRRGNYQFGNINLRYLSRLRLLIRQSKLSAYLEVKVYPNLSEVRKYELLARRGRLFELGIRTARIQGRGTEFERLRDYLPDDESKRINWKATARRGKLTSNEYQPERSQNVLIMLDAGRMMAASLGELTKLDYAVNAALMTSYIATIMDDKVGLLVFSQDIQAYLPPLKGKRQLYQIIEALYNVKSEWVEPDYAKAFKFISLKTNKRTLIVLFTDLVDPQASETLLSYTASLFPHHLPVCVTLSDSNILNMAAQAPRDSQRLYEKAVAQQVLFDRQQALEALRHGGALIVDAPPDKLSVAIINQYLELKARSLL